MSHVKNEKEKFVSVTFCGRAVLKVQYKGGKSVVTLCLYYIKSSNINIVFLLVRYEVFIWYLYIYSYVENNNNKKKKM